MWWICFPFHDGLLSKLNKTKCKIHLFLFFFNCRKLELFFWSIINIIYIWLQFYIISFFFYSLKIIFYFFIFFNVDFFVIYYSFCYVASLAGFMEQVRRFKLRVNYGTILSSEVAKTELTNKFIQFFSETDGIYIFFQYSNLIWMLNLLNY